MLVTAGLAVALGMDAFAAAIAAGATLGTPSARAVFRLAFHFGLFQFFMPLLGYAAGAAAVSLVEAVDHWIAFGLLAVVGANMIREALTHDEGRERPDPSRGWVLVSLSVATSIDAFAVGLTLPVMGLNLWSSVITIGLVAAVMTLVGLRLGRFAGGRMGQTAELLGGAVLLAIGIRIVCTHLMQA